LEFAGALYHLTARGNARAKIFADDEDRRVFLELLGKEISQQRWRCYAHCLMGDHYHLLIETPEANLVTGMRRFNGVYTQGVQPSPSPGRPRISGALQEHTRRQR
jgi:REP element-mobilizing transposase RayT